MTLKAFVKQTKESDGGNRLATENISRRNFFKQLTALGAGLTLAEMANPDLRYLQAAEAVSPGNPLKGFPKRGWEKTYRDIFATDSSFVFLCAPNDTHDCLLRAYVKNGIVVRISPTYGYGKAKDLYGNSASHRWDPRCCQKGLTLARRFYGDRRVKYPMVREGFKQWADDGFPRDPKTGSPMMDSTKRGEDKWLRLSWDEAQSIAAAAIVDVTRTYSGRQGSDRLTLQGYEPKMIESMEGAGTRTLKIRGGMPLLGIGRIFGFYRFANSLALLDAKVRGVTADDAKGARGWDNYSWHTDLPPGHPMVTGHQTVEFELFDAENSKLLITWGMNWISTKMPDSHWLTEARLKGTKIINITTDYQSTSTKSDQIIMIRPGTDAALAFGCCKVLLDRRLHDEDNIKNFTDLPLLVRMDNRKLLRAEDIIKNYHPAPLSNFTTIVATGTKLPPPFDQGTTYINSDLRDSWGDYVVWNRLRNRPEVITRDQVGKKLDRDKIDPALTGDFEIKTVSGERVAVRPVFSLVKEYLDNNFDLKTTSEITRAPEEAIISLAEQIGANKRATLSAAGMGPNHFFNADLKDRAMFLLAALTDNIGRFGANIGSYAGNYRGSVFNGTPQWIIENPFDLELDPEKPARTTPKPYYKAESAHYYNYGDRPLHLGNKMFTGKTHMPSPTKLVFFGNSNSVLGNTKWHYDVVNNTLPKIEAVFVNEWWWTASCEYADIVFPVDSWAEMKFPDISASCTNPFLHIFPDSPLKRTYDTRSDMQIHAGISSRIGELVEESRFSDMWKFINENDVRPYLRRIINASTSTKGYELDKLIDLAREGIPALMNMRTYPRTGGWEQINEDRPWYNRTGRLEFYRDEPEWLEYGENIPVWREPVDGTRYEPNIIVSKPHPALKPAQPESYGLDPNDQSVEVRQVRNIVMPWSKARHTKHPLTAEHKSFRFIFLNPKYRHGTHTTPADLDWMSFLFGPFGDEYRRDKRSPWIGEGYIELNPDDARSLGIEDGDYVWFDSDPSDRPYRGWKKSEAFYDVARGMARARYYNGLPPGVTRMWFNMNVTTKGSLKGSKVHPNGLAKNPDTNYQACFRHGSHQSATRAWLRPTLMTDTLTRKPYFGQLIGTGFESDVHAANGAPKESIIAISKAENGGIDGKGLWHPAKAGWRAGYESKSLKKFIAGEYFEE